MQRVKDTKKDYVINHQYINDLNDSSAQAAISTMTSVCPACVDLGFVRISSADLVDACTSMKCAYILRYSSEK